MRYLSFIAPGEETARLGAQIAGDQIAALDGDLLTLIQAGAAAGEQASAQADGSTQRWKLSDVKLQAPLRPTSLRDFYAFEDHVATAHANRGKDVPTEWYQIPVFYFSNPMPVFGPGENVPMPAYTQALDFELEIAAIVGRGGRDIAPENAEKHIFGYTVFNDWSARDVQRKEMKVGLGPAKGKDFALSLGPVVVTADELAGQQEGRAGVFNLGMHALINGEEVSKGNWASLHYSFGEMISRASEGVDLYPGEMIGSGTVGTGCLLELTKGKGPWLQIGDEVELEIEGIGKLKNTVS
jgi:fumarylacetoacetate (FAA) hydrolase